MLAVRPALGRNRPSLFFRDSNYSLRYAFRKGRDTPRSGFLAFRWRWGQNQLLVPFAPRVPPFGGVKCSIFSIATSYSLWQPLLFSRSPAARLRTKPLSSLRRPLRLNRNPRQRRRKLRSRRRPNSKRLRSRLLNNKLQIRRRRRRAPPSPCRKAPR